MQVDGQHLGLHRRNRTSLEIIHASSANFSEHIVQNVMLQVALAAVEPQFLEHGDLNKDVKGSRGLW